LTNKTSNNNNIRNITNFNLEKNRLIGHLTPGQPLYDPRVFKGFFQAVRMEPSKMDGSPDTETQGMNEDLAGKHIKAIRQQKGGTLQELADQFLFRNAIFQKQKSQNYFIPGQR